MFSRASNYKVAGLCGVFSDASCFMQVVAGIKENIMQRLNKWKKAFFFLGNGHVYVSYQSANKRGNHRK